jgi:hypothetical protein
MESSSASDLTFKWNDNIIKLFEKRDITSISIPESITFSSSLLGKYDLLKWIETNYEKGTLLYPYSEYTLVSLMKKLNDLELIKDSLLSPSSVPGNISIIYEKTIKPSEQIIDFNIIGIHIILFSVMFNLIDPELNDKLKRNRDNNKILEQQKNVKLNIYNELVESPSAIGMTETDTDEARRIYELRYIEKYTKIDTPFLALGYSPYVRSSDQFLQYPMDFSFIFETFYSVRIPEFIKENNRRINKSNWDIQEHFIKSLRHFFMPPKGWFEQQETRLLERKTSRDEKYAIGTWKGGFTFDTEMFNNLFYYLPKLSPKSISEPIILFHGAKISDDSEFFLKDAFGKLSQNGELLSLLATSWWPGVALNFSTKLTRSRKKKCIMIRLFIRHPIHAIFVSTAFISSHDTISPGSLPSNHNEREIVLKPGIYFRPRRTRQIITKLDITKDYPDSDELSLDLSTSMDSDYIKHHDLKNVNLKEVMITEIGFIENDKINILEIQDFETYDPTIEKYGEYSESIDDRFKWVPFKRQSQIPTSSSMINDD